MSTQLATMSKSALVKRVTGLTSASQRKKAENVKAGDKMLQVLGIGTAATAAGIIGYVQGRVRDKKDNTELSLGPVPVTVAAATLFTGVSFFYNPGGQLTYAAAGCMAAFTSSYAKALGTKQFAKKHGVEVSGEMVGELDEDDLAALS
jgi:hypothetical protein